jgi:hypothetical protein
MYSISFHLSCWVISAHRKHCTTKPKLHPHLFCSSHLLLLCPLSSLDSTSVRAARARPAADLPGSYPLQATPIAVPQQPGFRCPSPSASGDTHFEFAGQGNIAPGGKKPRSHGFLRCRPRFGKKAIANQIPSSSSNPVSLSPALCAWGICIMAGSSFQKFPTESADQTAAVDDDQRRLVATGICPGP